MPKSETQRTLAPAKIAEITDAARAFCVIYHTSRTYRADHAVFLDAVKERMPVIKQALRDVKALSFDFYEGQMHSARMPLEPGSSVFQRVAQAFEKLGIRNITFLPGADAGELIRLIDVVNRQEEAIRQDGLACVLQRAKINSIVSRNPATGASAGGGGGGAAPDEGTGSGATDVRAVPTGGSGSGAGNVWEITDEIDDIMDEPAPDPLSSPPARNDAAVPRSVKSFVSGVLGAMARQEADSAEVADIIATEFETRLEERVAVIRRESERKIRRLETVKELVLTELERLQIAAVIMDNKLQIVSMNKLAGKLLGNIEKVESGSALEKFVRAGLEKQDIFIANQERTAHLVTVAASESGSEIMLITLENK